MEEMKLAFCSIPRHLFYQRGAISAFLLNKNIVPINPYMNFDYNLFNQSDKETIRLANNNLVEFADELAVFLDAADTVPDGVAFEIGLARGKTKRLFTLPDFSEHVGYINPRIPENYYGAKLNEKMPVVYTAMSKHLFYYRAFISRYVLDAKHVPLNPFMLFDYFILDATERDKIRKANNSIVERADEIWVFGPIADGVLEEIRIAKRLRKSIKYFAVVNSKIIKEISSTEVEFEDGLEKFSAEL